MSIIRIDGRWVFFNDEQVTFYAKLSEALFASEAAKYANYVFYEVQDLVMLPEQRSARPTTTEVDELEREFKRQVEAHTRAAMQGKLRTR